MSIVKQFKTLAAVTLSVMVMAVWAGASETWDCGATRGTVTCTLDDNGLFTVSGAGNMANYDCDGCDRLPWSYFASDVRNLVIGNGVTSIGDGAFSWFRSNLMSVTIANSVTSIGAGAFSSCTGLTSVTIPNNVKTIGAGAFQRCTGLTSMTIPNSVASIGSAAFAECAGLTSVTIPNSVTSIGSDAFRGCTGLTSVMIPNSVNSIGSNEGLDPSWSTTYYGSFGGCTGLTKIEVGDGNTVYSSIDGVLFNKAKDTLLTYPEGRRGAYIIPNGVTTIGQWSRSPFSNCTGLTSVTIPNSVTSYNGIANGPGGVFGGCQNLTRIEVGDGNTVYSSIDGVLFNKAKDILLIYPEGRRGAYIIPNSVTSIGTGAFEYCSGLTSVAIPNSVTSIGHYAFVECTGLTSVTIPNSVTSIRGAAFSGCTGLTSMMIPNSVTYVDEYAFNRCTGLMSVTIGNSVNGIYQNAFWGCDSLMSVTSLGIVPPGNDDYIDLSGVPSSACLYVPQTAISAYRVADKWRNFSCIRAISGALNVTFDLQGGDSRTFDNSRNPQYVLQGTNAGKPADPDREGYTFGGWYKEAACTTPWNFMTDVVTSNITLYAKWTVSVSVLTPNRVVPQPKPEEGATVIAPPAALSGSFTAGPNPVSRQSGEVKIFRQGKRVSNCELRVYDATGNIVGKVKIIDNAFGNQSRRQVGSWNLCDKNGRIVSEGTYLLRGKVTTSDGNTEKVSVIVGVR